MDKLGIVAKKLQTSERMISGLLRIVSVTSNPDKYYDTVDVVGGWVKTLRKQNNDQLIFIALSDGSSPNNLQVVVQNTMPNFGELLNQNVASCLRVRGKLVRSPAQGQPIEMLVEDPAAHGVEILGANQDVKNYPLGGKKRHTLEHLRKYLHLRPRTNFIASMSRVRNALAMATHQFYQELGFIYVHTPIITASDCEGAGEMFEVKASIIEEVEVSKKDKKKAKKKENAAPETGNSSATNPVPLQQNADQDTQEQIREESATVAPQDQQPTPVQNPATTTEPQVRIREFFDKKASLTVSGQLAVENYACALTNVYTFGPTFRAENSHTSRHLAEFWMIEPEICFAGMEELFALIEAYIKFCVDYCFENVREDLEYFGKMFKENKKDADGFDDLLEYLQKLSASQFQRMSYTEAIEYLTEVTRSKKAKFKTKVEWGVDLGSEHERYICEQHFKAPVFLYDYPQKIKAFYMRVNDAASGEKTVACTDLLLPFIGEVAGGSVREERLDVLEESIRSFGLAPEDYQYYCDLRKYGTVPHGGFGVGFERLVMLVTGIENIRDAIPFPRYPGHCDC